eukprot:c16993_g2_i2 orf=1-1143(-)
MSLKDSNPSQLAPLCGMTVAGLNDFAANEAIQLELNDTADYTNLGYESETEEQDASAKYTDHKKIPNAAPLLESNGTSQAYGGKEEISISKENAIKRRGKTGKIYYNAQEKQIVERSGLWEDSASMVGKKKARIPSRTSSRETQRGNISKDVDGVKDTSIIDFSSFSFSVDAEKPNEGGLPSVDNREEETVEDKNDELKAYMHMDPDYSLGEAIKDWDRKRQQWLGQNPQSISHSEDGKPRLFVLSGSQPSPCSNPIGDHLLLRCLKNKIDYCRLHGIDIFYNMALLDPSMPTFWAKLPLVRATMLSHPEADWIWWVDADAIVTDMEFEIPLEKYSDYNFIVYGWEGRIFEARSWVGLNAGSFLIRNCQWSMEFMERWAAM